MAQYKTIALAMIEQRPELHEQLRAGRMLLATVNDLAVTLRTAHLAWTEELRQANPGFDQSQISSEAMEMAIQDLQDRLPSDTPASEGGEGLTLDEAMTYLRRAMPPA